MTAIYVQLSTSLTRSFLQCLLVCLLLKTHLTLQQTHMQLINHSSRVHDRLFHSPQQLNDQRKLNQLVFCGNGSRLKSDHISTVTNIGSNSFYLELNYCIHQKDSYKPCGHIFASEDQQHNSFPGSFYPPLFSPSQYLLEQKTLCTGGVP